MNWATVQKTLVVIRDLGSFLAGIYVVVRQTQAGHSDPGLLTLAGILLGVPGVLSIVSLGRGSETHLDTPESSPVPPPHSSTGSSSGSS